jgi:phosphotransferase system enzyme I (PtsI)
MSRGKMRILEGMAGAPGVAIGRAISIGGERDEVYRFPLPADSIEREIERLHAAKRQAVRDLEATRDRAASELGRDLASIFEAHLLVLDDPQFLGTIERQIRSDLVNAEWAVDQTSEALQDRFARVEVDYLRARGEDVRDVARHLIRALAGIAHHEISELGGEAVIVAYDLTPSEAVRLGRERVIAFALERGGVTSHTTIIARSLNIPLVAGLAGISAAVTDADRVIVDGTGGRFILHPTPEVVAEYEGIRHERVEREGALETIRKLPSVTRDGVAIDLLANIDLPEEIDEAVRSGAQGVGLYRSEFLFIERSPELPSEQDHVDTYRRLLDVIRPYPVVVRTFDLGGRKLARDVLETHEENPVLGLRGIRLTLARPDIFRRQIRAVCRAGAFGDLRIMLPLVSALEEVHRFKELFREVVAELEAEGVEHNPNLKIGVMIEVPSAAMIADSLAREVDFFSIGTNDLIQYSMAVDRSNEQVSYLYRPVHPGILRMIRFAVRSAEEAGIPVSLCGEMAADPQFTPLLVAIGLRAFSVTPRVIPELKDVIRGFALSDWEEARDICLALPTADDVDRYLATHRVERTTAPTEGSAR